MAYSLRLETLNIWGGRLYHALLAHIRRQADNVDIFCFQEVYMTQSDHLWARDDFAPPSARRPGFFRSQPSTLPQGRWRDSRAGPCSDRVLGRAPPPGRPATSKKPHAQPAPRDRHPRQTRMPLERLLRQGKVLLCLVRDIR